MSEAITGVDLVEWQLRVAAGEGLPCGQDEIRESGHAFEARLYAENPDNNFAPSIGTLTTLELPYDQARVDSGVVAGQTISPFYDPMIAKIITSGASRGEALGRLRAALQRTRAGGVETNARFLARLAGDAPFADGLVSTRYIEERRDALFETRPIDDWALAAALLEMSANAQSGSRDPWSRLSGFRLNKPAKHVLWIALDDGAPALVRLFGSGPDYEVEIEPDAGAASRREGYDPSEARRFALSAVNAEQGREIAITVDGIRKTATVASHFAAGRKVLRVWIGAEFWDVLPVDPLNEAGGEASVGGSLAAQCPASYRFSRRQSAIAFPLARR